MQGSFVSQNADTSINVDDPNFWQNILKNQVSESEKLLKESQTGGFKAPREQLEFVERLGNFVAKMVESKLNIVGYSADEEKIVQNLCQVVQSTRHFDKVPFLPRSSRTSPSSGSST